MLSGKGLPCYAEISGESYNKRVFTILGCGSAIQVAYDRTNQSHTILCKKSNEEIAQEVLDGKWGNGTDRKNRLEAAGYDYDTIQGIVNKKVAKPKLKPIDTIAKEVIQGKWGNGAERTKKLTAAGYDAKAVQKRVNELV